MILENYEGADEHNDFVQRSPQFTDQSHPGSPGLIKPLGKRLKPRIEAGWLLGTQGLGAKGTRGRSGG